MANIKLLLHKAIVLEEKESTFIHLVITEIPGYVSSLNQTNLYKLVLLQPANTRSQHPTLLTIIICSIFPQIMAIVGLIAKISVRGHIAPFRGQANMRRVYIQVM